MHLDGYAQALREDLLRLAAIGDESTHRAAESLAIALESALGRRMLQALAEAALELAEQLPEGRVEIRISGGDPELVYIEEHAVPQALPAPAAETVGAGSDARVTLRLPAGLKSRLEEAASAGGVSVNTWLVQMLTRALEPHPSPRGGAGGRHRLRGYGRA
jgi:hypothetical protein